MRRFALSQLAMAGWSAMLVWLMVTPVQSAVAPERVICQETDWSRGNYQEAQSLDTSIPGSVTLSSDPTKMALAFDPTEWENVTDMCVYRDKLYMTACTSPLGENCGDIIAYDDTTGTFEKVYTPKPVPQGLVRIRTFNDKIYAPDADPNEGWELGNLYIFDGNTWIKRRTIPHGIHNFDVMLFQGNLYVSTGHDDGKGHIYASEDDGLTWKDVFQYPEVGGLPAGRHEQPGPPEHRAYGRIIYMGVWKNTLFAAPQDTMAEDPADLFALDGSEWRAMKFADDYTHIRCFGEFQGNLYLGVHQGQKRRGGAYMSSDGYEFERVSALEGNPICDFAQVGDTFYASAYGVPESTIFATIDGVNWNKVATIPTAAPKPNLLSRHVPLEVYHGRLYASVPNEGKVYVAAAASEGYLISQATQVPALADAKLGWEAAVPAGSHIKFQVRLGRTEEEMRDSDFVGPDDTACSYFDAPGLPLPPQAADETWSQYQAFLTSDTGAATPRLMSIFLSQPANG